MSKTNKKPKDMNAPKKHQSSYFIYSNERRSALQKEHTGRGVTEISKIISAEWKAMDADKKREYEQKAEAEKKEYQQKFAAYQLTGEYKQYQQKLAEWKEREQALGRGGKTSKVGKGGKKKAPKKPKQPDDMPKRPQSSYFVFSNERRGQLKESYPDKKVTELSRLIADEWKVKTAEERKVYEDRASYLKHEYLVKIEEYKKTDEYQRYQNEVEEWKRQKKIFEDPNNGDAKISMPRKPKDEKCPKRPLTSYFLYAKEVRVATKTEFPDKAVTEIAKEISKKWKLLTEEEKKPYEEEAAKLKEQWKKDVAAYEGSEDQMAYKKKLEEWKLECDKRRQSARDKAEKLKKKEKEAMDKKKKGKTIKKKPRPRPNRMDQDSESESESSSDSDSSESDSSSDSDSDSDSDSESSSSEDSSSSD